MDSLILLSWAAYALSTTLLLLASWKLMCWLPFTLKVGISLSQLVILVIPASVNDSALAPVFIVLVLDLLTGLSTSALMEKALPLLLALLLVWPVAFVLGWSRLRLAQQNKPIEAPPEKQ